jgi:hypothetical protein
MLTMNTIPTLSLLLLAAAAPLGAQDAPAAASSSTYFLQSFASAGGGTAQSFQHLLDGALGACTGTTSSSRHQLVAGFTASLDTQAPGEPWLSAVSPRFVALRSGATVDLHGTALDQGGSLSVKIGGQAVTNVQSRLGHKMAVTVPDQPAPGWQPVEVTSSAGSTVLAAGIGILPMILTEPAAASEVPFGIVFKGSQGDTVVWALGIAPAAPLPLGGFGYGLALNPALILVLPGFGITGAQGELKMRFPATTYPTGSVYLQALFATANPHYGPASFSNVLRL